MGEALGEALGAGKDEEAVYALERGLREGPRRDAALIIFRTFRLPPHSLPSKDALASTLWALDSPAFVEDAPWAAIATALHPSRCPGDRSHRPTVVYAIDEYTFDEIVGVAAVRDCLRSWGNHNALRVRL